MRYTFHDFRRLFITDAIVHGMPPHIAQLVAGHRDINTTMGYKAVYPDEVINGHRAFIARRRALRPSEEYRTPTDAEWAEFVGHFERRKVAIGDCGRSYDTACIHEHSCLRCPLLRPDPAARATARTDPRQPHRPHRRSRIPPLVRRGRGPQGQPRRRERQTRPDGPDQRQPHQDRPTRHPQLHRHRRHTPTHQDNEISSDTTEHEVNNQDRFSSEKTSPTRSGWPNSARTVWCGPRSCRPRRSGSCVI